jgi:hypothetical protein
VEEEEEEEEQCGPCGRRGSDGILKSLKLGDWAGCGFLRRHGESGKRRDEMAMCKDVLNRVSLGEV